MNASYGRDLDLNLLRVFVVVADSGSVTQAASQLYLTQPAISAALRRLTSAIGTPLFARQGRGLSLTNRGEELLSHVRPHLSAIIDATLSPAKFDPKTSDRTMRLGLSDSNEQWLLPQLLRMLAHEAPHMRIISLPVQFRTVGEALLTRRIDAAVTVADELPKTIKRKALLKGTFTCLFDPRFARFKKTLTEAIYFAHDHVIVSYNGDLRGVIEDTFHRTRSVRCSVSTFSNLGSIVEGSALLATVPEVVAASILKTHPHLRTTALPFKLHGGTAMEILWHTAVDNDDAGRFLRSKVIELCEAPRSGRSREQS